MSKDRFVAFFDALMAIIMTIVVLEFAVPSGTNWTSIREFGIEVIVYAISFFWLGSMWISIHNLWHNVITIDRAVLWTNIGMLFFSSMIPILTVYCGKNITELVPELLYGIDIMCVTILNVVSIEILSRHHMSVKLQLRSYRLSMIIDLSIKIIGLIIGIFAYPVAILISVVIAMISLTTIRTILEKNHKLYFDEIKKDADYIE